MPPLRALRLGIRRGAVPERGDVRLPPELLHAVASHADARTRLKLSATSHATRAAVRATLATAHENAVVALQRPPLALGVAESHRFVGALALNAALQGKRLDTDRFGVLADICNADLFVHLQRTQLEALQFVKAPSRYDGIYAQQALTMMALCAAGLAVAALALHGRPGLAYGTQALFGFFLITIPMAPALDRAPGAPVSPARFLGWRAGRGYAASAVALFAIDILARRAADTSVKLPDVRIEGLVNLLALTQGTLLLRQALNCCLGLAMAALSFTSAGTRPVASTTGKVDLRCLRDDILQKLSNDAQKNDID